jgi:hypothetical protein
MFKTSPKLVDFLHGSQQTVSKSQAGLKRMSELAKKFRVILYRLTCLDKCARHTGLEAQSRLRENEPKVPSDSIMVLRNPAKYAQISVEWNCYNKSVSVWIAKFEIQFNELNLALKD